MPRQKIINDPIYGFISIPYRMFVDLIDHPSFQRLRRIKQGGFSHLVYPGAMHTRFHHTLGAFHLMRHAFRVLMEKDADITTREIEATLVAILMHDMGHGPFSHSLEWKIIDCSHEYITKAYMKSLIPEFGEPMELAIEIFQNRYPKKFLYQLISGQLDMDRMDYLTRDSFYTGVAEGVIGYDRIIEMLQIFEGRMVIEEKGLYSIEKFLMARRLMYWQVYYHKTVISAEQMLIRFIERLKKKISGEPGIMIPPPLRFFLENDLQAGDLTNDRERILNLFTQLDDADIAIVLKSAEIAAKDPILKYLAYGLVRRRLFRVRFYNSLEECEEAAAELSNLIAPALEKLNLPKDYLFTGKVEITPYDGTKDEIWVVNKLNHKKPLSQIIDLAHFSRRELKYYLAFPRF